jgi:hypothetical protein
MRLPTLTVSPADPTKLDREINQWGDGSHHYRVTLTYDGRSMSTCYHMGSAHTKGPKLLNVLDSLFLDSDCGADFEDFCANSGYDTDSRRAERTYKACVSIGIRLRKVLGADYDAIQEYVRKAQ